MPGPQLNTLRRIDAVWMAVSVDDDGTEGLCATLIDGAWIPLLAADKERLPFILEQARGVAKRDQRLVRIVRLHARTEIEQIDGRQ
jgi:hypothetical protein